MRLRGLGSALLMLLVALPAAGSVSEHPDFTENRDRPARIVLLPVQSSITRGRMTDSESLIKETRALEQALTREAARAMDDWLAPLVAREAGRSATDYLAYRAPRRVFDPESGTIDHAAAREWRDYDISHRLL